LNEYTFTVKITSNDPYAKINVNKSEVQLGELVQFATEYINGDSCIWRLGDGNRFKGNSVVHRYETTGDYRVIMSLYAKGSVFQDTLRILVFEGIRTEFTINNEQVSEPYTVKVGEPIELKDLTDGEVIRRKWKVGVALQPEQSKSETLTFSYSLPGRYMIKLSNELKGNVFPREKGITVVVSPKPTDTNGLFEAVRDLLANPMGKKEFFEKRRQIEEKYQIRNDLPVEIKGLDYYKQANSWGELIDLRRATLGDKENLQVKCEPVFTKEQLTKLKIELSLE
jgi:hypothetical protein